MKITFYGGVGEVGRSCAILENNEKKLMLDAGIKLGEKIEFPLIEDERLSEIKHILITHAHLDHAGFVPHIFAKNFSPKIYMVKPTRDLLAVLLADYLRIQKLKNEVYFSIEDINKALKNVVMKNFEERFNVGFDITFYNAGHILGSALAFIELEERKILYTGDLSIRNSRILEGAKRGLYADTLIIESTYGGKDDILPSTKEAVKNLIKSINETLSSNGFVLIPTFAVGRAQEILLTLEDYMRSGNLIKSPIFIDGMIAKAMRIYRQNIIYGSEAIKMRILTSDDDPFKSKFFKIPSKKNREDVFEQPSIIVTTSGMLVGGPALQYLKKLGDNENNKLIIIGYQAEGTLGRKLLEGERKICIDNQEIELKMKIENIRISGHADRSELIQFIKEVKGLKKVILIHGQKSNELKEALEKDYEVILPKIGEELNI